MTISRRRGAAFVTSVLSGALAVIALAVVLWTGYVAASCSSSAGQQGEFGQLAGDMCAFWTAIHGVAIIVLIATGASFLLATAIHLRRSRIPPPSKSGFGDE